jgi:hypothetical protein
MFSARFHINNHFQLSFIHADFNGNFSLLFSQVFSDKTHFKFVLGYPTLSFGLICSSSALSDQCTSQVHQICKSQTNPFPRWTRSIFCETLYEKKPLCLGKPLEHKFLLQFQIRLDLNLSLCIPCY